MFEGVFDSSERSSVDEAEAAIANAPKAGNSRIKTGTPSSTATPPVSQEEEEKPTISENLLAAIKQTMPELLKFGVNMGVQNAYEFEPTQYATSNKRKKSAQPTGINVNPISGSGFKDGGALLGRDLLPRRRGNKRPRRA